MHLVVLKVVDKRVKDHLLKERVIIHLLAVKIILLVEKCHLLVDNKMKKIVQIIQLHQDVNLNKRVKDHLLKERVIIHLLVEKHRLLVEMSHLLLVEMSHRLLVEKHRLLEILKFYS